MTEKPQGRRKAAKGGRPSYRPSLDDRQTVEQMKFCGEAESVISRAVGIDVDTLRKHFREELADGHAQRRKEILGLLFSSARAGNVAAIKKLEEMGRAAGAAEALDERARPEAKRGKKEEQNLAAQRVGGKFATPQAPKLVISNT